MPQASNPDKIIHSKIDWKTEGQKIMIQDRGVQVRSDVLKAYRIAFGICGGIGAVETVKIIRELRRNGASVTPFLTPSVTQFVTELSVEWACARKPIKQMSAEIETLETYDFVIVAPLTLNTLSKCAVGICDNAVTLLVASQIQRCPVLFVPTMNVALFEHPIYSKHVKQLEEWGVEFLKSSLEEDRMKMPTPEVLANRVIERAKCKR